MAKKITKVIFKRRRILGDLYERSESIESIPVYIKDTESKPIGTVEESVNHDDAFVFRLPPTELKTLSVGGYKIGVDYNFTKNDNDTGEKSVKLNHIILVPKEKALLLYRKRGSRSKNDK